MKIYQLAQTDSDITKLRKLLTNLFSQLEARFGIKAAWDSTYILNVQIEKNDPAHPMGESWIQVWHSRNDVNPSDSLSKVHIERYFESELAQDEGGISIEVPISWIDSDKSVQDVLQAVAKIEGL